jgi:hypothetical protein
MSTKFQLIADRVTCELYCYLEIGNPKPDLKPVPNQHGMFLVPCHSIFVPTGTQAECESFRLRVMSLASYQRGLRNMTFGGHALIIHAPLSHSATMEDLAKIVKKS